MVTLLEDSINEQNHNLLDFCNTIGWREKQLRVALTDNSVPDLPFYLEKPYAKLIRNMGDFIARSENSIFIIYAPHGHGKTSLINYTSQAINQNTKKYFFIRVDDPGLITHVELLRKILSGTGYEKRLHKFGEVEVALYPALKEARECGVTTIIWIDEGQKLKSDMISLIRTLSDIQTDKGLKVCKIIITGTPLLKEKLDKYELGKPEDITAFRERLSINTADLRPWTTDEIIAWWNQLSNGVGGKKSPFNRKAAEIMEELTAGVPRSIVQLTRCAIMYAADNKETIITEKTIINAFKERVHNG